MEILWVLQVLQVSQEIWKFVLCLARLQKCKKLPTIDPTLNLNFLFFHYYYCLYTAHPPSQCHRAMTLVLFPCYESWGTFWAPHDKKPWIPKVALVDFTTDGRPCLFMKEGLYPKISIKKYTPLDHRKSKPDFKQFFWG